MPTATPTGLQTPHSSNIKPTIASLPPQPTPRILHLTSHLPPPDRTMSALKPGPGLISTTSSTPLPTQQQQQQQQSQQAVQQRAPGQTPGLRYPSNRKTIYDRNLSRSKNAELSRAAFAFLFVEMIGYAQRRVTGIADLEKRWVFGACSLLSNFQERASRGKGWTRG